MMGTVITCESISSVNPLKLGGYYMNHKVFHSSALLLAYKIYICVCVCVCVSERESRTTASVCSLIFCNGGGECLQRCTVWIFKDEYNSR